MSSDDVESRESLLDDQPNGHAKVVVERPVFSQQKFDEGFSPGSRPQTTLRESFLKSCRKCQCSKDCFLGFLYKILPFIGIMKDYNIRTDLTGDIVSGLTVGIMHIPQGTCRKELILVLHVLIMYWKGQFPFTQIIYNSCYCSNPLDLIWFDLNLFEQILNYDVHHKRIGFLNPLLSIHTYKKLEIDQSTLNACNQLSTHPLFPSTLYSYSFAVYRRAYRLSNVILVEFLFPSSLYMSNIYMYHNVDFFIQDTTTWWYVLQVWRMECWPL